MICIRETEREPIRPVVYGIGLYLLVAGMDSFRIGNFGSVLKIIVLIPLAFAFFDLKSFRIRFSPALIFQLLFWFLAVLSLFYSLNTNLTLSSLKRVTLNLALVFVLGVMEQYNKRELQYMQYAMLACGWFTILLMLLFSDVSAGGRLTLLLGEETQDQNYINGYFLHTFSLHCNQMLQAKKKKHIIPIVFILSIVLLTGSRGALVAFVLVFFVHICVNFAQTKHKIRNIALVALLIATMFAAFDLILAQMPENVSQRFSWDYISEKGTTGRTRIWVFLLQHFPEESILRMLFGHGYGTTTVVNTLTFSVAHNLYLDDLIGLGLVGLILQLATQSAVVYILFKHRQFSLLGAYLGMIGMCMSLSLMAYKPIWNIMLLALAIDFHEKSRKYSYISSAS